MVKIDRLDHLVLTVKNIEKTCEFYKGISGMEVLTFGGNRKAIKFGKQNINLHRSGREFEPKAEDPTPGAADLCFITENDLNDLLEHLKKNKIEVIEGIRQRSGANGPVESVYFRDPDLNLIEDSEYV